MRDFRVEKATYGRCGFDSMYTSRQSNAKIDLSPGRNWMLFKFGRYIQYVKFR